MAEVPPFLWSDSGSFASPVLYTVPGAGEVQPYTATATYVNASGQAILPALRIKSDTGNLLSLTFPVGQTIADSTSAEVTFVPPFGSAQGSGTAPAASAAPNVATMWRSFNVSGDTTQTVNAHSSVAITFPHQSLPSDGSITWNSGTPYFMVWNVEAIALEMLFVHMDGGNYNRSAFGNANSRILQAQIPSPANMLAVATDPASGDDAWFVEIKPNAHVVNDTVSWGCYNGDAVAHHIDEAFIVVYFWPITGYGGGIPGWPP